MTARLDHPDDVRRRDRLALTAAVDVLSRIVSALADHRPVAPWDTLQPDQRDRLAALLGTFPDAPPWEPIGPSWERYGPGGRV